MNRPRVREYLGPRRQAGERRLPSWLRHILGVLDAVARVRQPAAAVKLCTTRAHVGLTQRRVRAVAQPRP